ncbi:MAG TPA: hypothetical protein PK639_01070 [Candidatus Woesebacteria bacterium]|nr:hypothetical protein [Candidatus Woesebacteria bacterium]
MCNLKIESVGGSKLLKDFTTIEDLPRTALLINTEGAPVYVVGKSDVDFSVRGSVISIGNGTIVYAKDSEGILCKVTI